MKKGFVCVVMVVFALVGLITFLPSKKNYDYLRLHIKANSNSQADQQIKYEIRCALLDFLSPYFCKIENGEQAVATIENLSAEMQNKCNQILNEKGFNYTANVSINKEYFPEKQYENTTLEEGYFNAVVVNLGSGCGDTWWCVVYPPLGFVNKNENSVQIKYKSRIKEWFSSLF